MREYRRERNSERIEEKEKEKEREGALLDLEQKMIRVTNNNKVVQPNTRFKGTQHRWSHIRHSIGDSRV